VISDPFDMASPQAIKRVETLIWILVYGGLIAVVLGVATRSGDAAVGLAMITVGALVAAVGLVLIWVRSRMKAPDAAPPNSKGKNP
jgi:hypothetical protein